MTLYKIVRDGQGSGGFLAPPGHPSHFYELRGYYRDKVKADPDIIAGVDYALDPGNEDVPQSVRNQAQRILDSAQLVDSERWERMVYGYFRSSYAPPSGSRNVSDSVSSSEVYCVCGESFWNERDFGYHIERAGDGHSRIFPMFPPERHLGYLCVKEYFPEHQPRLDLIADPGKGYGQYPCAKCRKTVQYEAREDALCVIVSGTRWRYLKDCEKGGLHILEGETE